MKKSFILLIILSFISGCSIISTGNGNVTIIAPDGISFPSKSVLNSPATGAASLQFTNDALFRYEIIVEANNKRINYIQLKSNQEKTFSVPSGIPLDIRVGLYCAKDSDTMDEQYNVYLATDSKTVTLTKGESRILNFTLNVKDPLRVDSYFNSTFDVDTETANFTSGAINTSDNTIFSMTGLSMTTASPTSKFITTSNNFSSSTTIGSGNGILSKIINPTGINPYWYIDGSGIKSSLTGNPAYSNLPITDDVGNPLTSNSEVLSLLAKVDSVKSVNFQESTYLNTYYYFLSFGPGYVIIKYDAINTPTWNYNYVDFGDYDVLTANGAFLLDFEQNSFNPKYILFATKIGLFYISNDTIDKFLTTGIDKSEILNSFKKVIKITSSVDKKSILVKKVRIDQNTGTIYLGTKQGIYSINMLSDDWTAFTSSTDSNYTVLNEKSITKLGDFSYDETIISMNVDSTSKGNILTVATPKRVWFKNLTTGKIDMITVWDGLPFVPATTFAYNPSYDIYDFGKHDVAPINFVLWNQTDGKYWIGTKFGLASISLTKILN
jgi:hypothetical protein